MNFREARKAGMEILAKRKSTVFLGQAVGNKGTFMSEAFESIPADKKIEFPVAESFQLQFSIGLAMGGLLPVSVYPRINFMLLAISDIVNMLDKISCISHYAANPRVIIWTAVGPSKPIDPGVQHTGDYSAAIASMVTNIDVVVMKRPEDVIRECKKALNLKRSVILVENPDEDIL
jgi:pyruvate/2-oxoglutarate/acetoin dehydrogenase E1 component